jgi:predicted MPP superfamily phosphohydrolase
VSSGPEHAHAAHGPLSGKRRRWRRALGMRLAALNAHLLPTPLGRWLKRRLVEDLELSRHAIPLPESSRGLHGLRIAFLSDLHAGHFLLGDDLLDLARRVARLEPHLVALGGDLINVRWEEVVHYEGFLSALRPPLGTFAVPGNHEYYRAGDFEHWSTWLAARGVGVLRNEGTRVGFGGSSLWVAGVDDLTEGRPDLDRALLGREAREATLFLSHHPDLFVDAAPRDVLLQLSGHTHGGQIRLFGWSPLNHSEHGFDRGAFRRGAAHLYVGRGVGVTALPFRFDAPPEVATFELVAAP